MSNEEFERAYDLDPRSVWNPLFSHYLHVQAWELIDLTPTELEAMKHYVSTPPMQ